MNIKHEITDTEKIYSMIGRELYRDSNERLVWSINFEKIIYIMLLVQGYCLSKYNSLAFVDYIFVHYTYLRIPGIELHNTVGSLFTFYELEHHQSEAIKVILNGISDVQDEDLKNAIASYPIVEEIMREARGQIKHDIDWYWEIDVIEMTRFFKKYFDKFTKDEVVNKWITSPSRVKQLKKTSEPF